MSIRDQIHCRPMAGSVSYAVKYVTTRFLTWNLPGVDRPILCSFVALTKHTCMARNLIKWATDAKCILHITVPRFLPRRRVRWCHHTRPSANHWLCQDKGNLSKFNCWLTEPQKLPVLKVPICFKTSRSSLNNIFWSSMLILRAALLCSDQQCVRSPHSHRLACFQLICA